MNDLSRGVNGTGKRAMNINGSSARTQPDRGRRRRRLTVGLACVFALAVVMGPGPGVYLVNPDPGDPHTTTTIASVPILYLWALFWFLVQATVVVVAYLCLWDSPDDRAHETARTTSR